MNHLDPDQLRTFVAIAETGSFTRAADLVAKTQSAVSMQIRRLEERIGQTLVERNGRASRLTAAGERLLPFAQRILKLQAEAFHAFDNGAEAGSVSLGVPDDYSAFLPEILRRFSYGRPLAETSVVSAPSLQLMELIQANELDLAIVTLCGDAQARAPNVLRREPLLWVASDRYNVHEQDPLPLALEGPPCEWRRAAIEQLTSLGREYRIAFSAGNATAIGAAVVAGLAVSVMPPSAIRPGMRVLGRQDGFAALPSYDIGLIRASTSTSRLVDALYEHIIASISQAPESLSGSQP